MALLQTATKSLRSAYRSLFLHKEDARTREIATVLRQVSIFQSLSRSALRSLAEVVHIRTYRRDEYIYYEGDPGLGMYIVRTGRVALLMEDEDGQMHELRQVVEHDLFGDACLLGDFRRAESAQAVTETQVLGFFRPDLNVIIRRDPTVGASVVQAVAQYAMARQVELLRLISLREGKTATAHLLHGATVRADIYDVAVNDNP